MVVRSVEKQRRTRKKWGKKDYAREIARDNYTEYTSGNSIRKYSSKGSLKFFLNAGREEELSVFDKIRVNGWSSRGYNWAIARNLVRSYEGINCNDAYSDLCTKLGKSDRAYRIRAHHGPSMFGQIQRVQSFGTGKWGGHQITINDNFDCRGWDSEIELTQPIRNKRWTISNGLMFCTNGAASGYIDSKTNDVYRYGYRLSDDGKSYIQAVGKALPIYTRHYETHLTTPSIFTPYHDSGYFGGHIYVPINHTNHGTWIESFVDGIPITYHRPNSFFLNRFLMADYETEYNQFLFEHPSLNSLNLLLHERPRYYGRNYSVSLMQTYFEKISTYKNYRSFIYWLFSKRDTKYFFVYQSERVLGTSEARKLRLPSIKHAQKLFTENAPLPESHSSERYSVTA